MMLFEFWRVAIGVRRITDEQRAVAIAARHFNLAALRILGNEAQQQEQAVASSKDSLQLLTNRYRGSVDTYLQVITAETTELSNERNATDILRRRMDASVLLVKALGGGWDISDFPTFGARRVKDY